MKVLCIFTKWHDYNNSGAIDPELGKTYTVINKQTIIHPITDKPVEMLQLLELDAWYSSIGFRIIDNNAGYQPLNELKPTHSMPSCPPVIVGPLGL